MLTTTQRAEIMLFAAEAGRCFVKEFHEELNPAQTDWDSEAWVDLRHTLSWIHGLTTEAYQEGFEVYIATLVKETKALVTWPWRIFTGDETRQRDGVSGQPAEARAWYVEPKDYAGDVLYSPAFPTRATAEAWADSQPAEDENEED